MKLANPIRIPVGRSRLLPALVLSAVVLCSAGLAAQAAPSPDATLPTAPSALATAPGTIQGVIMDTDAAAIPNAKITLEDASSKITRTISSETNGVFTFSDVAPGRYNLRVHEQDFSAWKVEDVELRPGQDLTLTEIVLGVEAITSSVQAIFQEDLAEQQITAETKQRILGILPNFYVSYVPNAAPLTRRLKFKLALKITTDPVTFLRVGVASGIEQWQGDFAGYGQGFSGYAKRYAASYADGVDATFWSGALLPSLFHQDPRYFYNGKGSVVHRALYAISTVVICKGDNGKWQPNYSNVLGNLAAGMISRFYYPNSSQHDFQVSIDNTLIGTAEGAFGTLFQEFLLHHFTHNVPMPPLPPPPPQP